mmetsp:Transcript_99864/g.305228  ORF Transcript_99864/g.305228 Transcript_99864/m.305228 type:complete len:231 (+) Transcript_99864:288-980(+)
MESPATMASRRSKRWQRRFGNGVGRSAAAASPCAMSGNATPSSRQSAASTRRSVRPLLGRGLATSSATRLFASTWRRNPSTAATFSVRICIIPESSPAAQKTTGRAGRRPMPTGRSACCDWALRTLRTRRHAQPRSSGRRGAGLGPASEPPWLASARPQRRPTLGSRPCAASRAPRTWRASPRRRPRRGRRDRRPRTSTRSGATRPPGRGSGGAPSLTTPRGSSRCPCRN